MAKKALRNYTYAPGLAGAGTVVVDGYWPLESFLLITNTTLQTIIYNFADTSLGGTISYNSTTNKTTLTLEGSTATQLSTDKLQIFVDDDRGMEFIPTETYRDPVSKFRVSEPQALIDTDFEYSLQPSKWEGITLVSQRPTFYARGSSNVALDITSLFSDGTSPRSNVTATTSTAHGLAVGDIVNVQDSSNPTLFDGTFLITQVPTSTTFVYIGKGAQANQQFVSGQTVVTAGGVHTGALIQLQTNASAMTFTNNLITVNTLYPHGLLPGTPIIVGNITATTNAPNGTFVITQVPSPSVFVFASYATPTGTLASGVNFTTALVYVAPESYQQHRSLDGGVLISTSGNYSGPQQIRQTRRYFRYQSGKAMQFSTGLKMTPTFDVTAISASGTSITVTTLQDHNMQVGATIRIEGVVSTSGTADSARYNIITTVVSVTGVKQFTYNTPIAPIDTSPGGSNIFVTCVAWVGGKVRSGLFDDQNGFFFEYDGSRIWAVVRNSVKELFGTVSLNSGNPTLTGLGTAFRKQLVVGDRIVIKGMTHEIIQINSDTSAVVSPIFRGTTGTGFVRYLKVQETRTQQIDWNLDKLNGTGPSGYSLDITNMQMAYIDYTWYGAGFIRFGFRATNGEVIYCHKVVNNNVNKAAYMRSGNLPARFEIINQDSYSRLIAGGTATRGSALNSGDTTMYVEDITGWPASNGVVMIRDNTNCEMVSYASTGVFNSAIGAYPLNTLTRRTSTVIAGVSTTGNFSSSAYTLSGTTSLVTFNPDSTVGGAGVSQVSVRLVRNTCAPTVSHWGVSVIMDGKYDDDKSIIFTAGMNRYLSIAAGAQRPLIAIRIAPSVDNGIGGNLGVRQLVNRMQLTLSSLGIYSQGQFLIEGILNPQTVTGGGLSFPTAWTSVPVGSGSLAQVIYFDSTATYSATAATASGAFTGGDRIFGAYTENSGGTNFSTTRIELDKVRDLGNSIISGDNALGYSVWPAGPDVLLISARNLAANGSSNIACRISWTEAQA